MKWSNIHLLLSWAAFPLHGNLLNSPLQNQVLTFPLVIVPHLNEAGHYSNVAGNCNIMNCLISCSSIITYLNGWCVWCFYFQAYAKWWGFSNQSVTCNCLCQLTWKLDQSGTKYGASYQIFSMENFYRNKEGWVGTMPWKRGDIHIDKSM